MRFNEDIQVKSNIFITVRERGKIVTRRDSHNIFLDYGREWLTQLMTYATFAPDVTERDDRVRYMGFGIGGTRQIAPVFADTPPLSDYGPTGAFSQNDTNPTVLRVERPVRVTGASGPATSGDQWIGQIQAPSTHDTPTSVTYRRIFTEQEISYTPYVSVPLSEVGLFTSKADPTFKNNNIIAYDTFDTLSKTVAFELELAWTLRIG